MTSVSIIIPAYNRADSLTKTLSEVVNNTSAEVEIVVVDDCSTGTAIADLCAHYRSRVRYLRTERNVGVIGARNFGYRAVSSDIIVNLDDDSFFTDKAFIPTTITMFEENPRLGAVAYNIDSNFRGLAWMTHVPSFNARTYTGCGNAWRQDAIRKAGVFYEGFWRQGEELEHCMRLYDAGYEVFAVPGLVVVHEESQVNRDPRRHMSLEAANYLKRIVLRVPALSLPFAIVRWAGFVARHRKKLSIGQIRDELSHTTRGLGLAIRHRRPVSSATYHKLEALKRVEAMVKSKLRRVDA